MKKALMSIFVIILLLGVLGFIYKAPLIEKAKEAITADMYVSADTDSFDPGTDVGQSFPKIDATYNGQNISSLEGFAGEKGTIFVVSRSVVWCPYCMKQMHGLNEHLSEFEKAGIKLVGLTYDSPQDQKAFKNKYSINYPILSDNNAASVINLGILNEEYNPGEEAYGIGHPGAFVLDADGMIVGKVFIEAYSSRVDAESLLNYAESVLKR
ncbi:peroxiredoxin family protein [Glaciecola petra]|uniref:Peroxiredoxin family protein n=1 Tax=Glaciecola petra TaxID=3075602 RepID=A0ABU2ZVI7_9ALTE|nr:peroxiredoxin family protein [Aestuariibacter sp. P117]MDT0596420.1 peroxiredoxin family protein [Aestuariibacter sp. P117]